MSVEQKVREYCENNSDFQALLENFTQVYSDFYNKQKLKNRKHIKVYIRRNFGRWYYSDMSIDDISPANFINSDVHDKIDKNVMVYPACKPEYKKEKLIGVKYEFKVFSLDAHPFLKDMRTYLGLLGSKDFISDKNGEPEISLEEALEITGDDALAFTFTESVYLDTIAKTCYRLGLAGIADAPGTDSNKRFAANEENIGAFFELPTKEQLKKVVDANAQIFIDDIGEFYQSNEWSFKAPTIDMVYNALAEGAYVNDMLNDMFEDVMEVFDGMDIDNLFLDESDFEDATEEAEGIFDILNEKMEDIIKAKYVSSLTARGFFIVFGNYLQLIQPLYSEPYSCDCDSGYIQVMKAKDEGAMFSPFIIYMISPDMYILSPLGVELFRDGKPEEEPVFYGIESDDYEQVLEDMLSNYEEDINDIMDLLGGDIDDMMDALDGIGRSRITLLPAAADKFEVVQGLNPNGQPFWDEPTALYRLKVKYYENKRKYQIIEMPGDRSLSDLAFKIIENFDLDPMHQFSFYMGKKFYEPQREISSPYLEGIRSSADYRICDLKLFKKQKFLFLYDFGSEVRFEIEFMG